jgi:periplasmic protein TonB
VVFDAVIAPSGCIRSANILRSIPALDIAALRAVLDWQYEPMLLNGRPVPVVMTVTVNFTLQ